MIIRDRSFLERQQTAGSESYAFVLMQSSQFARVKCEVGVKSVASACQKILINVINSTSSVVTSTTQVEMTWGKYFHYLSLPS